jgi:Lrp/AsnC family transcriptional regulator for asnA, asnC and gidA
MDDVDRKVISQLQTDGRTSFRALGKIISYTSMGAKKRFEKLLSDKAIKISTQMSLKHFKLCAAVVLIETDGPETTQRLLKRFEDCPRVLHILTTIGGYNMIALVVAENQETLESISMEQCSLRSDKGIRRSEFYPIRDIHYSPFIPVRENLTHRGLAVPPCNVDCKLCERYITKDCVRCPATEYYLGSL